MDPFSSKVFHDVGSGLDFREALGNLLNEFRLGRFADGDRSLEEAAIKTHLGHLTRAWDSVFADFPVYKEKRRTLLRFFKRERKDAHIRSIATAALKDFDGENLVIVNPAAVEGRQARRLAESLPQFEIIGTDIDARWETLYRLLTCGDQQNFRFVRENIYDPDLGRKPVAIIFFGACGSLSDGAIDYGIQVAAPFLIFRTCCHENICRNTGIVKKRTMINRYFAMKNWQFARYRRRDEGFYFSGKFNPDAYPRSEAARELGDPQTYLQVARNAVDSDICIAIIDLDRALYLQEQGYNVMYRDEVFFALKRNVDLPGREHLSA
ncbi:MAG: hypothetical protein GY835_26870 [bacterium]|nr:hypothetical protein [bacterium]